MFEQRSTIAALVAACMVTAFAAGSFAQQAAPPAVLVQAAELTPIADQSEFIGRAAAVDKVELRARVKGFLGPRKFADGDMVKKDEVVFTIEPETYQAAVDQKVAQRDSAQAALDQRRSAAPARRRASAHQNRHPADLRPAASANSCRPRRNLEDAKAQLRDAEIQLSYTDIKSPIDGRIGRAAVSPGNLVSPDSGVLATVVSETPIRVLFPVTQRELLDAKRDASAGDPPSGAPEARRRQHLQGEGQARLHRHHGRSQDRRPDRARDLRQQGQPPDRRPDRPRRPRGRASRRRS